MVSSAGRDFLRRAFSIAIPRSALDAVVGETAPAKPPGPPHDTSALHQLRQALNRLSVLVIRVGWGYLVSPGGWRAVVFPAAIVRCDAVAECALHPVRRA
jgi:hypothetical protein